MTITETIVNVVIKRLDDNFIIDKFKVHNYDISGGTSDNKVKYDVNDTLSGYLGAKTAAGTGITLSEGTGGDADKLLITNSAPDQTVALTAGTNMTSITGTYPNFTLNAATQTTDISGKLSLDQTTSQTIINGQPVQNTLTASELVSTDANKKLQSLAVATYPSLTEISYIKGLTSGVQSQLNGKQPTGSYEVTTNKKTSLTDNSDTYYPSQKAVKTAVDAKVNQTLYDTDKSYLDNNSSAGRLWGGEITDATGGSVNIAAGAGLIKNDSSDLETVPTSINDGQGSHRTLIEWDAQSLALAGVGYNLIYWDASESEFVAVLKDNFYSSFDFTTDFTIGRVYYDGTNITIRLCGMNIWNFPRRVQMFGEERFPVERSLGLIISAIGTRNIAITSGVIWAELVNRFTIDAFDSSASGTFTYWYRDGSGGWTSIATQTQINNTQYDNNSGTLQTLTNNRYGVHWVYIDHTSNVHVIFGQGDYSLANANLATTPATLPGLVGSYSTLVGKIIIEKSAASFTSIQSPFATTFQAGAVTNHNDLGGLQGGTTDEYYHLTSAQTTVATQAATSLVNGYLTSTDWSTFNSKLTDLIDDQTPQLYTDLDCNEKDLDNVKNIIHDATTASDFVIQNIDEDKDIKFSCNDGGSQTDIMILDGSAGQLSGLLKATNGVVSSVASLTRTYYETKTWTVQGEIKTPSSGADVLPPFEVNLISGQTAKIVKWSGAIESGTSCTFKLQASDGASGAFADVTGFTAFEINTTYVNPTSSNPNDYTLADGEVIQPVCTAVAGTPKNLMLNVVIEYTLTIS